MPTIQELEAQLADPKPVETAAAPTGHSGVLGAVGDFVSGIYDAIPGYNALEASALGAAGFSEQSAAAAQEQARQSGGLPGLAGRVAGGVGIGLGLGALTAGVAPALGAVGSVLAGGAEAAALVPAYKLGETAHQAQLRADPLRLEQITHTLFSTETAKEMLEAFGLTALTGGALAGAGKGLAAASKGLANAAGRSATRQTAGALREAAVAAHLPVGSEIDMAQIALEKHMLRNPGRARALMDEAGASAAAQMEKLQPDYSFRSDLAAKLDELVSNNNYNPALKSAARDLQEFSASIEEKELTGPQIHNLVKSLGAKARSASNFAESQFYGDAAAALQEGIEGRLGVLDPAAAQTYKNANADYYAFSRMEPAMRRFASQQVTEGALAGVGAAAALATGARKVAPILGEAAELGAMATGYSKLQGKSYAVLLDKYSKAPPFATYIRRMDQTVKSLLNPANMAQVIAKENAEERYDKVSKVLTQQAADPEGSAERIRSRLDFLPPHEADAITGQVHNQLQEATIDLSGHQVGPATAFGQQLEPSPREKRAFVEKLDCRFDPYKAALSGRPDLIALADKCHPETMQALRVRLINEMADAEAKGKPIPYSTKRKLSAILGVAGVPMQDPALGAKLQQIIQQKRKAETQAGQMGSALQAKASQKADQATLSRSQQILNNEGQ